MGLLTPERTVAPSTQPVVPVPPTRRRLLGEQMFLVGAQVGAGLGNFAFALLAVRVLPPAEFAALVAFLAGYLLLHMPTDSLAAGAALDPALEQRLGRRILLLSGTGGLLLAAAAVPLSGVLGLPLAMVLLLAAATPGAGLLALARGRLYGEHRPLGVAATLLAEPLVRLGLGLAVGALAGAVAAAAAVVAAGYTALLVAKAASRLGSVPSPVRTGETGSARPRPGSAVAAFLLLAVLQSQQVLFANRLLPTDEAAVFAALATLGGITAFATSTIPLVLLPRLARGSAAALPIATLTAVVLGSGMVAAVAVVPDGVLTDALGPAYAEVAGLAVLYLSAMALLGVVRVLTAARCATGAGRWLTGLLVVGAAAQAAGLLAVARTAEQFALVTLATTGSLALLLVLGLALTAAWRPATRAAVTNWALSPAVVLVGAWSLSAFLLRLSVDRSLWLDEATSWRQARLPFDGLLFDLATTDVHPPLWGVLLWGTVRVLGDGEVALRLPAMLAGTATVPALFLAGRDLFSRRAGYTAAALGAVAPLAVWYGQEARMYSLFMLFATLSLWTQVMALRTGRARWWAGFVLSTTALLWTQWFALLPVAVQLTALLVVWWRRRRSGRPSTTLLRGAVASVAGIGLLCLPLVPYLLDQLAAYGNRGDIDGFAAPSQAGSGVTGSTGSPGLSTYTPMINLAWAVIGYHDPSIMTMIVALWPLMLLLLLVLLGRGRTATTSLCLALVVVPPSLLFAVAQFKPNLFELRYFIGAVPVLLLLIARAVSTWTSRPRTIVPVTAALTALMAVGLYDQQTGGENPRRYDFRDAIRAVSAEAGPEDVLVHAPPYLDNVVEYYGPDLDARPLDAAPLPPPGEGSVFLMESFRDRAEVAAAVDDARVALEQERRLVGHFTTSNVEVWEYR